eukprot:1142642-Pelagomonas_calceolata.AAC.9
MRIADWFPTSRQKSGQEQHTSSEAQKPPDFCASKFPEVSAVIYVSVSCLSASAFRGSMQQLLASACMVYDVQCMNLCLPAAQVWSSFVNSLADFGFAGQPCGTPEQCPSWAEVIQHECFFLGSTTIDAVIAQAEKMHGPGLCVALRCQWQVSKGRVEGCS